MNSLPELHTLGTKVVSNKNITLMEGKTVKASFWPNDQPS